MALASNEVMFCPTWATKTPSYQDNAADGEKKQQQLEKIRVFLLIINDSSVEKKTV